MLQWFADAINPGSGRMRLWQGFVNTIRGHSMLALGFCLWWMWIFSVYQSFITFPVVTFGLWRIPTGIGPLSCIALTLIATAILYRRKRFVLQGKRYYALIAIAMTFGAIASFVWRVHGLFFGLSGSVLWAVASLLIGLSSAFMYIEFNRIMGWFGLLKTFFFAVVSVLAGTSLLWVASGLPPLAFHGILLILPASMTFLLWHAIKKEGLRLAYFSLGNEAPLPIPYKFICTSFAEGLSNGLIIGGISAVTLLETSFETVFFGALAGCCAFDRCDICLEARFQSSYLPGSFSSHESWVSYGWLQFGRRHYWGGGAACRLLLSRFAAVGGLVHT